MQRYQIDAPLPLSSSSNEAFLSRPVEHCDRIDRNLSFAINPSKAAMRITANGHITIPRKNP